MKLMNLVEKLGDVFVRFLRSDNDLSAFYKLILSSKCFLPSKLVHADLLSRLKFGKIGNLVHLTPNRQKCLIIFFLFFIVLLNGILKNPWGHAAGSKVGMNNEVRM